MFNQGNDGVGAPVSGKGRGLQKKPARWSLDDFFVCLFFGSAAMCALGLIAFASTLGTSLHDSVGIPGIRMAFPLGFLAALAIARIRDMASR
jgi:hypothetical protein